MKQPYSMFPSGWKTCLLVFTLLCVSGFRLAAAEPEQHLYAGIGPHLHQFSLDGKSRIYATVPGVLSGFDVDEDGTFWATTGNKLYRVDRHNNEAPATVQNKGVTEFATGLGQCRGMAIGPNGDFWIADRGKGDRSIGIIKIDRQTGEKTLIKEKSDEVKGNIYSVERGPNGNLYASAQSGHTVTEFKPDGTPVRGTPEKPEPLISGYGAAGHRAMVFDVNGDILFIGLHGIERFDSNGTHLGTSFKWTGEGVRDGKLDRADFIARAAVHPMDLAVDQNGIVYGSDGWSPDKKKGWKAGGAIYRYNKDGSRELFFEAGAGVGYLTFWPRTRYSHSPESGALNKSKAAEPSESSSNALPSFPDWQCLYVQEAFLKWDTGLAKIAAKGGKLKRIEFGRGSVVFPEDLDRLKKALPNAEIVTETYDRALHGNKFYESRLKAVMTKDEFARLVELAGK